MHNMEVAGRRDKWIRERKDSFCFPSRKEINQEAFPDFLFSVGSQLLGQKMNRRQEPGLAVRFRRNLLKLVCAVVYVCILLGKPEVTVYKVLRRKETIRKSKLVYTDLFNALHETMFQHGCCFTDGFLINAAFSIHCFLCGLMKEKRKKTSKGRWQGSLYVFNRCTHVMPLIKASFSFAAKRDIHIQVVIK